VSRGEIPCCSSDLSSTITPSRTLPSGRSKQVCLEETLLTTIAHFKPELTDVAYREAMRVKAQFA
jgi:hypothetical protein